MKLFRSIICLATVLLGVMVAQESTPKIAGTWKMALETPHGPMPGSLILKQDGTKITGSVDVEHMGSMPLVGEVAGKKISFSIEVQAGQKVTFNGDIAGDKMSGGMEPAGTWSASRGEAHI